LSGRLDRGLLHYGTQCVLEVLYRDSHRTSNSTRDFDIHPWISISSATPNKLTSNPNIDLFSKLVESQPPRLFDVTHTTHTSRILPFTSPFTLSRTYPAAGRNTVPGVSTVIRPLNLPVWATARRRLYKQRFLPPTYTPHTTSLRLLLLSRLEERLTSSGRIAG
jgi:hypothetical protein